MPNSLSRKDNHRRSLLRNLATSLVLYEEIRTTAAKARAVKPILERLLTVAQKNNLTARRQLLAYFFDEKAVKKTFEVLVPRFAKTKSGFIHIYKLGPRLGDGTEMVLMKLAAGQPSEIKAETMKKDKNANQEKSKKTTQKPAVSAQTK